jgi:YD repeat-containing protein
MLKYTHNAAGDLKSVTSPATQAYPNGKTTRFNYTGGQTDSALNHNMTMIMDPKGQVYLLNEYGTEGLDKDRVIAQRFGGKDAPKITAKYERIDNAKGVNDVASRTTVTDRLGISQIYEHNKLGLRLSGEGYKYWYNKNGLLVKKLSPEGKQTIYTYDTKSEDRLKQSNLLSKVEKGADGATQMTVYSYGPFNLRASETVVWKDKSGETRSFEKVKYEFDSKGRRLKMVKGGVETSYSHNEFGQVIREASQGMARDYAYEGARVARVTESAGKDTRSVGIEYDTYGYISAVTDAMGNTTKYWANALGQVVQKRDPLGVKSFYKYDANDNMTGIGIDNVGGANREEIGYRLKQEYLYNIYDNLISRRVQVSKDKWISEKYEYDAGERLTKVIQPSGMVKRFEYDDRGWLVAEAHL